MNNGEITNNIWLLAVFFLLIIWSLIWKGLALWKAARSGGKTWFVLLLVINTLGILDIIYLFIIHPRVNEN